ncbi:MAG: hypothetical protein U0075_19585 [Thermomicrobiales bacterium]|jgi:hypothetical protein
MPDVKFYEQGRRADDFIGVQDRIEGRSEWAIVLSHMGWGNIFEPMPPTFEVWVNGRLAVSVATALEALGLMRQYLEGRRRLPG